MIGRLEKIIAGIGLLSLTACGQIYIPESRMLRQIESIPPNRLTMSCLHKSVMYHKHLKSKGYKSRVVSGRIDGHRVNHAWVEVYNPKTDSWFMIDPTSGYNDGEGFETNHYPERKIWLVYHSNATEEDLARNRKIKEIRWENIPSRYYKYYKRIMKRNKTE